MAPAYLRLPSELGVRMPDRGRDAPLSSGAAEEDMRRAGGSFVTHGGSGLVGVVVDAVCWYMG